MENEMENEMENVNKVRYDEMIAAKINSRNRITLDQK